MAQNWETIREKIDQFNSRKIKTSTIKKEKPK